MQVCDTETQDAIDKAYEELNKNKAQRGSSFAKAKSLEIGPKPVG